MNNEENDLLTRVEGDAPMGRMLREWYWVPAARSARIAAGMRPTRLRYFGIDVVVFRTAAGALGALEERCPHRGASLALAHPEQDGIRCVYHGWRFDTDGRLLEAPNEALYAERLVARIRARSFPAREAGGIVWLYMGDRAEPPHFQELSFTRPTPANNVPVSSVIACNWMQTLEGALDSGHVAILHQSHIGAVKTGLTALTAEAAPVYELEQAVWGLKAAAIRRMGDGTRYLRETTFVMPWFALMCPNDPAVGERTALISVPVDDTHTTQWYVRFNPADVPCDPGFGWGISNYDPDDFTPLGTAARYWGQDRGAAAAGHFTGFTKHHLMEDAAIQASLGPIADRTREHLASSDAGVVQLRRFLLAAVRDYMKGQPPPGSDGSDDLARVESRAGMLAADELWRAA